MRLSVFPSLASYSSSHCCNSNITMWARWRGKKEIKKGFLGGGVECLYHTLMMHTFVGGVASTCACLVWILFYTNTRSGVTHIFMSRGNHTAPHSCISTHEPLSTLTETRSSTLELVERAHVGTHQAFHTLFCQAYSRVPLVYNLTRFLHPFRNRFFPSSHRKWYRSTSASPISYNKEIVPCHTSKHLIVTACDVRVFDSLWKSQIPQSTLKPSSI